MKKTFIREDALEEEFEVKLPEAQSNVPEKKESTILPSNNYFG